MPYKRKNRWIARVRKQGKEKHKSCLSKKDAKAWECKMQRIPVSDWTRTTGTTSLGDWSNWYLDYVESRFTRKTYLEKRVAFQRLFVEVCPETPLHLITADKALTYLQKQKKARGGNRTNKDRKNLVAGWEWGKKYKGFPAVNPFRVVRKYPEERKPRYVPPLDDFWKVYDRVKGEDQLMLLFFFHTGARRGEVFRLRVEDINFGTGMVRLYTRKTMDGSEKHDWLPMTDELYDGLIKHVQGVKGEHVFTDPQTGAPYKTRQHWMKKACERSGVKPFGFHSIRHLTASELAQRNVPLPDIQDILRHESSGTTQKYIRRLRELKPSLSLLPGKKGRQRGRQPTKTRKPKLKVVT